MTRYQLSPSLNHQYYLKKTKQSLSFTGKKDKLWQSKLRRKVKDLLGWVPETKTPLNTKTLWVQNHEHGKIEKVVFRSEPFCDVPAYVCLPKNAEPPYKWFICLQGHSTSMHNSIGVDINDESKKIEVAGDRDFALSAMKNGYAALCIEQRSFGERKENKQKHISSHGCHDATMHALMLGRTLLGERIYDVDRGIDYLYTRKDVDRKNIGVMGNSGGGTVTLFAAATLPRISFAMPSCYFCTFADSIMSIYHCADNYVPGLIQFAEMSDVLGTFAPKPVVIVAGKEDPIFPIKAVRKAFKDLKVIYKKFGAEENCQLVIGNEGHRFYADPAWKKMNKLI